MPSLSSAAKLGAVEHWGHWTRVFAKSEPWLRPVWLEGCRRRAGGVEGESGANDNDFEVQREEVKGVSGL